MAFRTKGTSLAHCKGSLKAPEMGLWDGSVMYDVLGHLLIAPEDTPFTKASKNAQ